MLKCCSETSKHWINEQEQTLSWDAANTESKQTLISSFTASCFIREKTEMFITLSLFIHSINLNIYPKNFLQVLWNHRLSSWTVQKKFHFELFVLCSAIKKYISSCSEHSGGSEIITLLTAGDRNTRETKTQGQIEQISLRSFVLFYLESFFFLLSSGWRIKTCVCRHSNIS